jgi:hypothetical protein
MLKQGNATAEEEHDRSFQNCMEGTAWELHSVEAGEGNCVIRAFKMEHGNTTAWKEHC